MKAKPLKFEQIHGVFFARSFDCKFEITTDQVFWRIEKIRDNGVPCGFIKCASLDGAERRCEAMHQEAWARFIADWAL